jgi:orotate phosphoribosyltransferase
MGGSARATVKVVRECGGIVVGVSALCNRGGVTAETLSVPWLESLVNIKMETWAEHDCPMCAEKVPVRTDVGKGKEFLARKNAT